VCSACNKRSLHSLHTDQINVHEPNRGASCGLRTQQTLGEPLGEPLGVLSVQDEQSTPALDGSDAIKDLYTASHKSEKAELGRWKDWQGYKL
jgi:hypothetical protein